MSEDTMVMQEYVAEVARLQARVRDLEAALHAIVRMDSIPNRGAPIRLDFVPRPSCAEVARAALEYAPPQEGTS